MENKRGLSTIVVTLILILVSLAAVGLVWFVVSNLLKTGNAGADISARCLGVNVEATIVKCGNSGVYANRLCNVTVSRTGTNSEALGGIKLIFKDNTTAATSSGLVDIPGDVTPAVGKFILGANTSFANNIGEKEVDVMAYLLDDSQQPQSCTQQVVPFTTNNAAGF